MDVISKSFVLHYASFMLHLGVITADYTYISLPTHGIYSGRFKFLTFWSFLLGLVYYNLSAVFDFLAYTRGKESKLWNQIRDYVFTSIVFPLAMFVCTMFWILYTANPSFMRSAEEEKLITWWMNHGYHTLPLIAAYLDAYFVKHNYPRKRYALIGIFLFNTSYILWLLWIAYHANVWVYPFLEKMSFVPFIMFIAGCVAFSLILFYLGKMFSEFVWKDNKNKAP